MSTISRRGILKGLVGGALVLGFDPLGRTWVTEANASTANSPLPDLDGTLRTDPAALAEASDDWGHIVHRMPVAVLSPGSVDDIAKMMKYARAHGLKIAGRGRGHTAFGQSQADAGIVIDMRSMNEIHSVSCHHAVVDAGVVWRDLLLATLEEGLAPPVLTDFINLTVGGTLSVGGVGGTSFRYGAQVDNVEQLTVVTGKGDVVVCSREQHEKLFDAALAGLGLCGIIVRVKLRLIPAKERAETYKLFYTDPATMLDDVRTLVAENRFDYLHGTALPGPSGWSWYIEATTFYSPSDDDDCDLLAGLSFDPALTQIEDRTFFEYADVVVQTINLLGSFGLNALPHPWLDLFVPSSVANGFVTQTMAQIDPAQVLPGSIILFYAFNRCVLDQPLFRVPNEDVFFLFDVLRTAPPDPNVVNAILQQNRALFEANRALGGTSYVISAVEMAKADWQQHFGSAWQALKQAKNKYDPHNLLGAGTNVF